jgi:hypothetical protein
MSDAQQRIFFVCYPDTNHTIGGVKQIYRQVEILHRHGYSAWVVQEQPGFRADWFSSAAPVIDLASLRALELRSDTDRIVLPETWLLNMPTYFPGIPKLIFNQNAYYTFGLAGRVEESTLQLYRHDDLWGVVTVSEDNARFLVQGCGVQPQRCHTVLNGLDGTLFFPPERKTRRILFLGRKHADHARTVMQMAQDRPALRRYGFRELGRVSHQQMAQELREALVFLSCGHPEGFGLPLAEAIACGCICVGYHGLGGRDFCSRALHAVEFGDLLGFLNSLEQAIAAFEQDPHTTTQHLLEQALAIRSRYATEREVQRALQVWGSLMAGKAEPVV